MKYKIYILFIIFSLPLNIYGQIGFRSHFGNMSPISNVANFYNDNRPWLSNPMGTSSVFYGFEIGLEKSGRKFGGSFFKIHYVWNTQKASGTSQSGEEFIRTMKISQVGIEYVDFWWTPLHYKQINFGFGLMPLGSATINMSTKYNGEKKKITTSHNWGDDYFLGFLPIGHFYIMPHLDITHVNENRNFHLQFFYTLGPNQEYDLAYLNKEINPTYFNNINKRTLLEVRNFGMKLSYNLSYN